MKRLLIVVVPLVLAACGGSVHARHAALAPVSVRTYGRGAQRTWVFEPAATPKLVVLFVHGLGDVRETTPYYHRPWLEHLAREGYEVVYPAYEAFPFEAGGLKHLVQGLALAAPQLAHGVPVAAIGYSRGGRLAVDYASVAAATGLVPARILSVFPAGNMDTLLNLAPLTGHTKILILAGDKDTTVGTIGAGQLVTQLAASGFPYNDVRFEGVHSHGSFVADHLSVLSDTPAARQAYWARADRFFAPLTAS
jgi:predicted esterase